MLKVLTITNHERKILYLSPWFNGSTHDYAMMTAILEAAPIVWTEKHPG